MPIGVTVSSAAVPPTTLSSFSTQNAFIVGEADWGPVGTPVKITSVANMASQIGTPTNTGNPASSRTATCANAFDAVQTLYNEDGPASPTVYFSRVAHGTPVNATLALAPSAAITITALYPGAGGNGINVVVNNSGASVVITLQDSFGNILYGPSPSLATPLSNITAWLNGSGYVTATSSGSTLPSTIAATPLAGGTDNFGSATITDWQTALAALPASLGPGQVFAPGQNNNSLPGISSALGLHAQNNNRVALCNTRDNQTAAQLITDLGTFGTGGTASFCGFWAGNRTIPGVTAGTTRSVTPDSVIAGLCARSDVQGNPNLAPAGPTFPLTYATTPTSFVSGQPLDTYSDTDLATLNAAGINTFRVTNTLPCNYGFVSCDLSTSDAIYWQLNHARLRMYIASQAQIIGQRFAFQQIDGQGVLAGQLGAELTAMLLPLAAAGALWAPLGTAPADAFTVDTGSDVNTPATQAAGQLNATITCSFSYYAQNVQIQVNVIPITTSTAAGTGQ